MYFSIKAKADYICIYGEVTSNNDNNSDKSSISSKSHSSVNKNKKGFVELPVITLPFNGDDNTGWLEFRYPYMSLIHTNDDLSPVRKFHYLCFSLQGSAAKLLKSLEISGDNYERAWEVLCERCNNKRMLVLNHIKYISNLDPIAKESSSKLKNINDLLLKHAVSLRSITTDDVLLETLLMYIVTNKLDRYIYICNKHSCPLCKKSRLIQNCDEFCKLSPQDRVDKIKQLKLCLNCYYKGHFSPDCKSKYIM